MTNKPEATIATLNQRSLDTAMKVAQLSFDNSQRVIEFQLNMARSLFEEGLQSIKEAAEAKNPEEVMRLRTRFAQGSAERMLNVTRQVAEMAAAFQIDLGKALSVQMGSGAQEFNEAIQQTFKGIPMNPADAFSAMEKAFAATRDAYETIARQTLAVFNPAASTQSKSKS